MLKSFFFHFNDLPEQQRFSTLMTHRNLILFGLFFLVQKIHQLTFSRVSFEITQPTIVARSWEPFLSCSITAWNTWENEADKRLQAEIPDHVFLVKAWRKREKSKRSLLIKRRFPVLWALRNPGFVFIARQHDLLPKHKLKMNFPRATEMKIFSTKINECEEMRVKIV